MYDHFNYGALRVILDQDSGEIVAVQCRTSGASAILRGFSPVYIAQAERAALEHYASRFYA